MDGHMRSKKQIIIIIFLCDDDEERSPFPLPPVVSKENDPARLLISQKEAHATTVVDARSEEKESARGRERCSSPLCIQRYFPQKRKKKTKISPSHQSRRNASHLFTREFALQFLSAETDETDCARKENISSLLLRRSRLYSLAIENNSTRIRMIFRRQRAAFSDEIL